ncbi:lysophospholipid acyltransferase family protein [Pseudohalioglobus lutimaris]|uniref:1-acyl-sn-glycerol-3-phosphate acyltransferase n=1 Tax=Pseudohalioglobus lutimaris TaxID=1737061 RepID=A0A2N5X4H8_9GAMM|nr:lysophospholipid acyltransferase family protein [Pseudohalioglobus lutimaris]PLW69399.1 1-acyl-sn-glycerol-3-phosphate acyltransferase [Pseudohalioglobus lutimaris]
MNAIRSLLVFIWLVLTLIPFGLALVFCSLFLDDKKLWWWFAVPWLKGVIGAARIVGGVKYRLHGEEHLPREEDMRRVVLCSKHQSTWETFFFPSMTSHPLAYVFKKELLRIPVFGWCIGRLRMVHIDRTKRSEAWNKVAEQGKVLMDEGKWIIMFPEGTRTERGSKGSYKTGASRLAITSGACIIPIAVTSGRCWPRRSFSFLPGTIDVSIGEPVYTEGREQVELMDEIERWIEAEMRRLDPEAYQ